MASAAIGGDTVRTNRRLDNFLRYNRSRGRVISSEV